MPNHPSPSTPNMTIETSDESSQHFVRNDHNHHPLQFSTTTDINLAHRRLRAPDLHVPVNMTDDLRDVGTHYPTDAERARGDVHSQVPPVAGPSAAIIQHHGTYIQPDEQINRRRPTPYYLTATRRLGFFPTLHLDELAADKKNCPVCTDLFSLDDRPMLLDCNHLVGRGCMERWVESGHNSCPMCRMAIFRSSN